MDLIVRRMKEAKEKYTAGSIGFYTSGQLFAEENYTLSVIRTAGIGTLHIDGNTKLCTATAGAALKETFGADGQPTEEPNEEYPFFLTTGRVVYHFHTRTKTGRSEELRDAAPDAFIQMNEDDARRLGIADGEMVRVTSRRGAAEAPARIGGIGPGTLFIPFHYGYWDAPGRARAANELTLYEWDAVSKQPHFKYAAVKLEKVSGTGKMEAS